VDLQIHIHRVLHKEVAKAFKKGTLAQLSPTGLMSLLVLMAAGVAGNVMLEEQGPLQINVGAAFAAARDCIVNGGGTIAN